MRDILFKAKRVDNGEWVEGFLFKQVGVKDRMYYAIEVITETVNAYEVDENTVCQYTGLTDKNGNKIWENDIVRHTYTTYAEKPNNYPPFESKKEAKNYVIKFDNTASYMGYRYHNGRNIFPFKKGTVINGDDEVIGNIFDNPELLKGE